MLHNFSAGREITITAKKREALQEKLHSPHLSRQCSLPQPPETYSQCPGFLQQNPVYSPIYSNSEMKEFVLLIKRYLIVGVMQRKDRVNIHVGC